MLERLVDQRHQDGGQDHGPETPRIQDGYLLEQHSVGAVTGDATLHGTRREADQLAELEQGTACVVLQKIEQAVIDLIHAKLLRLNAKILNRIDHLFA
ncbi:hypothetical protein GCM10010404_04930 [Nonomuraea africana]